MHIRCPCYRYPLIIRLETLADKAVASQHSLDSRTAGDALVPWVQSQTTCAVLGDVTPGSEEENCKVLRQRIWVHELFYDLQVHFSFEFSALHCCHEAGVSVLLWGSVSLGSAL
jgi:hypothetical protein